MNFFCTENEFDQYARDMGLDMEKVIKADIGLAVKDAKETFLVSKGCYGDGKKRGVRDVPQ